MIFDGLAITSDGAIGSSIIISIFPITICAYATSRPTRSYAEYSISVCYLLCVNDSLQICNVWVRMSMSMYGILPNRMHPAIRCFPSLHFYQNRLIDAPYIATHPDYSYHPSHATRGHNSALVDHRVCSYLFYNVIRGQETRGTRYDMCYSL
jgi:hypothetical protein